MTNEIYVIYQMTMLPNMQYNLMKDISPYDYVRTRMTSFGYDIIPILSIDHEHRLIAKYVEFRVY